MIHAVIHSSGKQNYKQQIYLQKQRNHKQMFERGEKVMRCKFDSAKQLKLVAEAENQAFPSDKKIDDRIYPFLIRKILK